MFPRGCGSFLKAFFSRGAYANIKVVDCGGAFLDPGDTAQVLLKYYAYVDAHGGTPKRVKDGAHFDISGYQLWADCLVPEIESVLNGRSLPVKAGSGPPPPRLPSPSPPLKPEGLTSPASPPSSPPRPAASPTSGAQACPAGFLVAGAGSSAKCMSVQASPMNASAAAARCAALAVGATLASPTAPEEVALARELCLPASSSGPPGQRGCWLGLAKKPDAATWTCSRSRAASCGGDVTCACAWRWAGGGNLSTANTSWARGRPIDHACASFASARAPGGRLVHAWTDVACESQRPFLCQVPFVSARAAIERISF